MKNVPCFRKQDIYFFVALTDAKFDHSYSNSPAVFKEFNNLKELCNHCPIAIEVERCGIDIKVQPLLKNTVL